MERDIEKNLRLRIRSRKETHLKKTYERQYILKRNINEEDKIQNIVSNLKNVLQRD